MGSGQQTPTTSWERTLMPNSPCSEPSTSNLAREQRWILKTPCAPVPPPCVTFFPRLRRRRRQCRRRRRRRCRRPAITTDFRATVTTRSTHIQETATSITGVWIPTTTVSTKWWCTTAATTFSTPTSCLVWIQVCPEKTSSADTKPHHHHHHGFATKIDTPSYLETLFETWNFELVTTTLYSPLCTAKEKKMSIRRQLNNSTQ